LADYGVPLNDDLALPTTSVWYGIPSRDDFSASSILEVLGPNEDQVIWFQHEFGIWRDNARFVKMLRDLNETKVVTLHSLHFQSSETPYGLCRKESSFLQFLLPNTDAITVFSDGVYRAVTQAFPEYIDKVHVLKHGTHLYPGVARMSRAEAKARIHGYLIGESGLDEASKGNLRQQRVFLDPDTMIIGGAGFIHASKGADLIYQARNELQQMLPRKKIAAVYVGFLRQVDISRDREYAAELRANHNSADEFFLETYLPEDMLPLLLRAFDVYFYWPSDCTQSGIMAHALGAGATIACRDIEGVGETVRMAGGLTYADFGQLIYGVKQLMLNSGLRDELSARAVRYAEEFSWRNQALKHFELAELLCRLRVRRLVPTSHLPLDVQTIGKPSLDLALSASRLNTASRSAGAAGISAVSYGGGP